MTQFDNLSNVMVLQKDDFVSKHAAIVVNYGGSNGFAHFLEHKMFEDKDLNLFDSFTRLGATVNAYTNFEQTVYYFSTIDSFNESLELLSRLIQNPHFTDENVEKEKGIILSEIDMYQDNPYWRLYSNLFKAMFQTPSLSQDVLGSKESVLSIKPNQLYDCYNKFYVPNNMALICAGDFSNFKITQKNTPNANLYTIQDLDKESHVVNKPYIEDLMGVNVPLFKFAFKATYKKTLDPIALAATSMIPDLIAGESSQVYSDLYDLNAIDNQFSVGYLGGLRHGVFMFAGVSRKPEKVREYIFRSIKNGLTHQRFAAIKSKHIGQCLQSFNSLESLLRMQADLSIKGYNVYDMVDAYQKVQIEDVDLQWYYLNEDSCTLSVVR